MSLKPYRAVALQLWSESQGDYGSEATYVNDRPISRRQLAASLLTVGNNSVADIAKRLGVNRDTFYSYFPRARANSTAAKG